MRSRLHRYAQLAVAKQREEQRTEHGGAGDDDQLLCSQHQPVVAAQVKHHILVRYRQALGFGAYAGNHGDQAARHVAYAYGQHHHRKRRLTKDGPDHDALQQHAEQAHRDDGAGHGQPERKAQKAHAGQAAECAQHHQVTLGETDGFSGLVDQHEAQRNQAINATLRDAADHQLKKLHARSVRPYRHW